MSTFEVKVYELKIEPHPNADAIELARVGDYLSVVRKGQFQTGDLGVYIPEASLVPAWLIEKLGLTGKLAGTNKNRVKAMKLRGILSQGLVYPVNQNHIILEDVTPEPGTAYDNALEVVLGQDVQTELGITKWEPIIPVHMAGEVWNASGYTVSYDIENIKKYPDAIKFGEDLLFVTEKLHGTWSCFGYHRDAPQDIVTSKGLSGQGLAFKFNEANTDNLYVKMYNSLGKALLEKLKLHVPSRLNEELQAIYLLGEIYGRGVQDLVYGTKEPAFRAFDILVKYANGISRYMSGSEFWDTCKTVEIETVPILAFGTMSRDDIEKHTNGIAFDRDNCLEVATSKGSLLDDDTIREGVVVRLYTDHRRDPTLGRVILKSVSEAYLLRKGNATEYT